MRTKKRNPPLPTATHKVVLKSILLTFEDGDRVELDLRKVDIVDRMTRKPLFKAK